MRFIIPVLAALATPLAAQNCAAPAMLVFDGSGSMLESGADLAAPPKIIEARAAVAQTLPQIALTRDVGLVTYGPTYSPGGADACRGITLHFAPKPGAGAEITEAIDALEPSGNTALTTSVALAARVLGAPGEVVLVTDGQETCGGAPCALAQTLGRLGQVRVHVIGFKVRGAFFEWQSLDPNDFFVTEPAARCLADETGGQYIAAENAEELSVALRETLGCTLLSQRWPIFSVLNRRPV